MGDDAFLRAILASPENEAPRLIYADWLEERDDPRAQLLRDDWEVPRISFVDWDRIRGNMEEYYLSRRPELRGLLKEYEINRRWRDRLAALGNSVDSDWLAVIDTLCRPFHPFFFWNNTGPRSFEAGDLPFREQIGTRGLVVTFESAFRGDAALRKGLIADLRFLRELRLGECEYGAAGCPIHSFICELETNRHVLTGADVVGALKAREFRSQHIQTLTAETIAYPGYHPGTDNDEVHNDPNGQGIFPRPGETATEGDEWDGLTARGATHEALKAYVKDGRLWYVLLHSRAGRLSGGRNRHAWVVLFAVGRSPHGNRLLGVVSHQLCHNFCD